MVKAQEFLQEWEKINNPFYPSEMKWTRLTVNKFALAYDNLVKNGANVKLREVCPACQSKNVNPKKFRHAYCFDCKSKWTRE